LLHVQAKYLITFDHNYYHILFRGVFDDLFKKKGLTENISIGGQEYTVNVEAAVYSNRGLEEYEKEDYLSAISFFSQAIYAMPDNNNFYLMRGTAYEDAGNDLEAEKDFVKSLQLNPGNFVAAYRLGFVHFRNNDLENAINWLRESYHNSPTAIEQSDSFGTNSILYIARKIIAANLGNFLIQLEEYDEGFTYLFEAIELDPNYSNAYFVIGLGFSKINKPREAIVFLRKAHELGHPKALAGIKKVEAEFEPLSYRPLLEFVFESSDHLRYENGQHVAGPHGGARRAIKVEPNNDGQSVSVYNMQGIHPIWQNNVQVAPKQMKIIQETNNKIVLRGFGEDNMGEEFSNYGLTIVLQDNHSTIEKCILHMHDRGVDIEYLP
jgi:tetratricopeptide (TPR) repeat protein